MREDNPLVARGYLAAKGRENDPATLAVLALRPLAAPILAVAVTVLALSAIAAFGDSNLPNSGIFEFSIRLSALSIFALSAALVLSPTARLLMLWILKNPTQVRLLRWTVNGPMLAEAIFLAIGVGLFLVAVLSLGIWGFVSSHLLVEG